MTTIPHARRLRDAILQPHATADDAARWLSPVILGADLPAWRATLGQLHGFAARASVAGHWWAPADIDSAITADDIASPEAWAAARERLHAAAREHSDWGGVEAPAWGEPLCHASAGGREAWGVALDGGMFECRTRKGSDGWVYIVAAALSDDDGVTYAAALCPGEAAGQYLDGLMTRTPEALTRRVIVTVRADLRGGVRAVTVDEAPEGLPGGLAAHARHLDRRFAPAPVYYALTVGASGAMTAFDAVEAIAWRDADRARRAAEAAEYAEAHATFAQRAAEFLADDEAADV